MTYYIKNNISLTENIYRYGSNAFLALWKEARYLYSRGAIEVKGMDKEILVETNLGEWGMFEGKKVPLDMPMMEEEAEWPEQVMSRHKDIIFKLVRVKPDRAKYELIDAETGKPWELGGRVYNTVDQLLKAAETTIKPQGGTQSTYLGEINLRSAGVKDVLRKLYRDQELLDKLGFRDIQSAMKYIKGGSIADFDELINDVEAISKGELPAHLAEAEKKNPELNKPKRGGPKKFYVYVRDPKTKNIKKVNFGDAGNLKVKIDDPKARKAFAARHNCAQKTDKTSPGYWSCRIGRYWKSLGGEKNFSGYW